jgi:hypothetical protein
MVTEEAQQLATEHCNMIKAHVILWDRSVTLRLNFSDHLCNFQQISHLLDYNRNMRLLQSSDNSEAYILKTISYFELLQSKHRVRKIVCLQPIEITI